ncbi:MAG TPA: diguanylate cyclase [Longimicrobiales bacterium]|nr:diguanylate cyclase [Longimicrobiales bacterium]
MQKGSGSDSGDGRSDGLALRASGARSGVPPIALLLSLLCLSVPVVASSLFPTWTFEDEGILVWILALMPAFLLSYYHGWRGASVALAGSMAAFSIAQVLALLTGVGMPPAGVMIGSIMVLVTVSLGTGWLSARLRSSLDQAQELALTDALTELANRRHAMLHLRRAFAAAQRGEDLSVVIFDLDRFKQVNDRHGHHAGDDVLREFGRVLRANTREMNLAGRFGGEEFIAILDGVAQDGAVVFAERVRQQLATFRFDWGRVTASAGICEYEAGMASPDVLVAAADQALYRAKKAGRDRVAVLGAQGRGRVQPLPQPAAADGRTGAGETVLVVDDDPAVVRVMGRALKRAGYHPLESSDAQEALAIARGLDEPIGLVVADIVMPKMSGFRLVEMLAETQPFVRALYISGYGREDVEWSGTPGAVKAFLPKPIPIDRLTDTVRQLLDTPVPEDAVLDPGVILVESTLRSREELLASRVAAKSAELEEAYNDVVMRLARAAEYRDDMTGRHAERVGRLAGLLARELGLDADTADLVETAAPLHDVGKIAVPDSLLQKPGDLTDAEREVMRNHCLVGARLLSDGRHPLLQEAQRIALSHHEWWDGHGYPQGLSGRDIPLSARITAVADAYDSMTQMRAYGGVRDRESALAALAEARGSQFDPDVVDALLRVARAGQLDALDRLEMVGTRAATNAPATDRPARGQG